MNDYVRQALDYIRDGLGNTVGNELRRDPNSLIGHILSVERRLEPDREVCGDLYIEIRRIISKLNRKADVKRFSVIG